MAEASEPIIEMLETGAYLQDETLATYLKQIGSSGVDNLLREPNRLQEEKEVLQIQTQELAFTNYKTFIQTAECSRQIFKEFNETETKLNSIINELPHLKTQCKNLAKISENISEHLRINEKIQQHSAQIMDILEVPQLMESAIRQGQFEEALELFSHMRRLGAKHGNISVIARIVGELEGSWRGMVDQLLSQLRSDLPLPKCLQVMGFLRRMNVYTDPELRMKFLQTRTTWLRNQLAAITATPGESLSMKKLEVLRVQLFNILTQYRALFSDDEVATSDVNEVYIFYTWITEQISHVLSVIEDGCSGKHGDTIESILGQAMYFGLSFSRVGVDFRCVAALRVHRAALSSSSAGLRTALRRFEQDMSRYVLAPGSVAYTPPPSTADGPPYLLLEFPPLAELTNGISRVFNELRSCAPLSIAGAFTCVLREVLNAVTKVVVSFYRQEETALGPGEKATLSRFCLAYQALLAYLSKAVSILFPPSQLSLHLGLPIHQIQSLEIISLKEDVIIGPLKHLIPS